MINDKYAFQQEMNARTKLVFKSPMDGINFYDIAFVEAKKLDKKFKSEGNPLKSWDDERLLSFFEEIASRYNVNMG